jgi:hypothetical protein
MSDNNKAAPQAPASDAAVQASKSATDTKPVVAPTPTPAPAAAPAETKKV